MHSLKTKLVLTISLLVVVLFTLSTGLFLGEKQKELTNDIYVNARSFGELTAQNLASDYHLYLAQQSFVYFNRDYRDIAQKFQDLAAVQMVQYSGEIVFDSTTETEKQYEGPKRQLDDKVLLEQIQSRNASVRTLDTGRTVYLKKNDDGTFLTVDVNEKPVAALAQDEKIAYLVQSASNDLAVIYRISYQNLQDRVNQTMFRGLLLGVFGVGVGILMAFLYAGSITKPLKKLTEGVGIIATGNFQHRVVVKTKDEIATLANAFNKMAQELEISTKALVYKERVAKELELAAKIQKEILPKEIPKMAGLDISAGLLPAEEIGGDSYDFIRVNDNDLLMYLGDVTGHGVPSGIVVSVANALIYNYAKELDIKSLLVNVNRILKDKTTSNMFMTLVMLRWNGLQNELKYVSAGHEQMVHYHAKEKKVTLTPAGGIALGMLSDVTQILKEDQIVMEKDDTLVIYSDGIPECWRNEKEMYGMARLKRAVSEYSDLPSAFALRNALLADVKEYAGKYKQMDDITLIVLKKT
jgi:serine phosphatase RsbU (regulator of sigma subunit)